MAYTCGECGATETKTHPGEMGYGVHVSCAECNFPLDYCNRAEYRQRAGGDA